MSGPLAYFLTWTCHGTWLHGDSRGSVDREHNQRGTPPLAPNAAREDFERSLAGGGIRLCPKARAVVEQTIRAHCEHRRWRLRATNARTNHVHVVVACPVSITPERAMLEFKAWSTRRLRELRIVSQEAVVWTTHGSTRWINDDASLQAAIDYVVRLQDLKGT